MHFYSTFFVAIYIFFKVLAILFFLFIIRPTDRVNKYFFVALYYKDLGNFYYMVHTKSIFNLNFLYFLFSKIETKSYTLN